MTSLVQTLLIALAAATWIVGGQWLVRRNHRRLGGTLLSEPRSPVFPFKQFNDKEWLILIGLGILSLLLGTGAALLGPK